MPVLQRDLEKLVVNGIASDELVAELQARIEKLEKVAKAARQASVNHPFASIAAIKMALAQLDAADTSSVLSYD